MPHSKRRFPARAAWLALVPALVLVAAASVASAQELDVLDRECDVDFPGCVVGVQGLSGAQDLVVSPDGKSVYVVGSLDDALLTFDFDDQTGQLTFAGSFFDTDGGIDGLASARGVAISPDGRHVYVAALLDSSVSTYSRNTSSGLLTYVGTIFDNAGADGLAGANAVEVTPDGAHVIVAGRSEDALAVFSRNETTGELTFEQTVTRASLDAPEGLAVSPDGKYVYVAGEDASALTVFTRNADSGSVNFGTLTFAQELLDDAGRIDGLQGAGNVTVSPDGKHVYVGAEVSSGLSEETDWVAVFARHPRTGRLAFVQALDERDFGAGSSGIFAGCSGVGPATADVAVSPDGRFAYVTHPFYSTVTAFARNPRSGRLTLANTQCLARLFEEEEFSGAEAIVTSPDGTHVLTAALAFASVTVLGPGGDDPTDVELLAPLGGETLPTGQATVIRWEPHLDAVKYHVYLSLNGGRRFRRIGRNVPGTVFLWNVPFQRTNKTDVVVRVVAVAGRNRRVGESRSDPLAIEAIDLTSPMGGATLTSGDPLTITWDTRGTRKPVASVLLRYTLNGRRFRKIELLSGDPGTFDWTVPDVSTALPRSKVQVILRDSRRRQLAAVATDFLTIEPAE